MKKINSINMIIAALVFSLFSLVNVGYAEASSRQVANVENRGIVYCRPKIIVKDSKVMVVRNNNAWDILKEIEKLHDVPFVSIILADFI